MDINEMIAEIKARPDAHKIGMIVTHLGIVRGTSREGVEVRKVEVDFDRAAVERIVQEAEVMPGIVAVMVEVKEGLLEVGEDIMAVAVAGDIRENVFPALVETVNRLKREASRKKEH